MYPTAVRLFILFAIISLAGFFAAGWTAGAAVPVMVGVAGMFAAAVSVIAALGDHTMIAREST